MSIDYTPETEDEVVLKEKLRIFARYPIALPEAYVQTMREV
jgi:hypothetical protein